MNIIEDTKNKLQTEQYDFLRTNQHLDIDLSLNLPFLRTTQQYFHLVDKKAREAANLIRIE